MPRFQTGRVLEVLHRRDGLVRMMVKVGRSKRRATAFTQLSGDVSEGDEVILNTTGVDLGLGTGGEDFVLWNRKNAKFGKLSGGHILKLRYTPGQFETTCAESPESKHHETLKDARSLGGMPVIACGLHSQLAPVAAMLKNVDADLRVVYVMTDGAALPMSHSDLVAALTAKGTIDGTITCGHAFGGELECVNIFTGLVAASEVLSADVAIVAMGPGIVGTGTSLGHTGMEQGQVLSAAAALGGRGVAALRISFADERERHTGVSHHSISALRFGAWARSTLAVPDMGIERLTKVMDQLHEAGLAEMHDVKMVDAWETLQVLDAAGIEVTTMGRTPKQDVEFFESAGAAALVAAGMLYETDDL